MATYVLRRAAHAVLVLWTTFTAAFLVLYWLPGDAAISRIVGTAGSGANLDADIARLRSELGYDQPVVIQYAKTLVSTATGDWGRSIQTSQPVVEMFADAIPETLKLALSALVIGTVAGALLGLVIAYTRSPSIRQALLAVTAAGVSVPTFWIGLLAIELFSFRLGWVPAFGNDGLQTLILPAFVLSIPAAATTAQLLSATLRTALHEPYITMARAKGGSRSYVLLVHALRNSIIPVITALGMTAGTLIGGTVVLETVFSRLGIGSVIMRAVTYQDTPVVLSAVLFTAFVFVLINFIVDVLYPLIDPRVDLSGSGRRQLRGA